MTAITAITAAAHVNLGHLASVLPSSSSLTFRSILRERRRTGVSSFSARCSLGPVQTRRFISFSLVFLNIFSLSKVAQGGNILDKYVKRKKLDPLETYIPAVLLTGLQIKELDEAGVFFIEHELQQLCDLFTPQERHLFAVSLRVAFQNSHLVNLFRVECEEHSLEDEQPKFAECRFLLRSGPASSFRVNVRAVAQYASDAGNGKPAFDDVDQCLRALEDLDYLLLQASRNQSEASVELMKSKISTALDAMDSLLRFVPMEVLNKGKAMADAYFIPDELLLPQKPDPELKKLESIL